MRSSAAHTSKILRKTGTEDAFLADSSDHMQRLAVATFLGADRLDQAVRELAAESIKPDQLCLVGTAPRIAATKAAIVSPAHILPAGGPDVVFDLDGLPDGARFVAAPARFDRVDFGTELQPQGLLHGLETAMADGAIALVVMTRSVAQFAAATRILLRYSTHRVRTREVLQPRRAPE